MALDMSDALNDQDMTDTFSVVRRALSLNSHGRGSTVDTTTNNVVGVVTIASSTDLKRHPEIQFVERAISIVTPYLLLTAKSGYQPDKILWRGGEYLVQAVDPYPQFGAGFYQVIAESMKPTDA